jgi:hypothetical protein
MGMPVAEQFWLFDEDGEFSEHLRAIARQQEEREAYAATRTA